MTSEATGLAQRVDIPSSASSARNNRQGIDYNHPLFLSPTDVSGISIISFQLQERFDRVDGSRTYSLHKEIATLQQGTTSVSAYYTKLKALWDEFEVWVPSPCCNCDKSRGFVAHMNRQKLYQFLMGLNDMYHQARSQILMIDHLPNINQAYAMIVGDESQKDVVTSINNLGLYASNSESVAMYSRVGNSSGIGNRFKKNTSLICEFCKCRGHTKESCYKVVGYPPDFKSKRRVQSANMVHTDTNSLTSQSQQSGQANFSYGLNTNVSDETLWGRSSTVQHTADKLTTTTPNKAAEKEVKQLLQGCTFTNDQYEQILMMMNQQSYPRANAPECNKANNAGATNHMVSKLEMLLKESVHKFDTPKDVCLPNGGTTQELYTGKVKEVGREEGGLYLLWSQLTQDNASKTKDFACYVDAVHPTDKESDMELWHKRLGHYTKNQFGKVVKVLRSDNGTEFVNSVCDDMFKALGIIHQRSCPYTPQQNGVAERKHRHLLKVTRALRFQAKIPIRYWDHCVLAAAYLINRLPSSVLEFHTPYERLYGRKPDISHLRTIGCLALAKNLTKHDKLKPRSRSTVHMGYSEVQKGYILFDLHNNTFFVNRNVSFREDIFLFAKDDGYATQHLFVDNLQDLGETAPQLHHLSPFIVSGTSPSVLSEEATCVHPGGDEQGCVHTQPHTDVIESDVSDPTITRRSTRSKHPPTWMKDFVSLNVKQDVQYPLSNYVSYSHLSPSHQNFIAAASSVIELTSYAETVKHPRWIKAMKTEI
ncbi:uncharacterized protein LOC129872729 [Solanum dulcamara]|uniref:uncharacterized protein LOC129872729 n=1 Tax=Solanum dulcamara TaxID=45834 RepID=UPI0024861F9C|nr:uncharacterized protein LOC129872729 [Solanum dulcamara]